MRDDVREFLGSLPWRRIILVSLGLGFVAIEFWTGLRMGRRSPWVLIGAILIVSGASDDGIWTRGTIGYGGRMTSHGRRWLDERKKRAEASKGCVQRARERRLGRWRKGPRT